MGKTAKGKKNKPSDQSEKMDESDKMASKCLNKSIEEADDDGHILDLDYVLAKQFPNTVPLATYSQANEDEGQVDFQPPPRPENLINDVARLRELKLVKERIGEVPGAEEIVKDLRDGERVFAEMEYFGINGYRGEEFLHHPHLHQTESHSAERTKQQQFLTPHQLYDLKRSKKHGKKPALDISMKS